MSISTLRMNTLSSRKPNGRRIRNGVLALALGLASTATREGHAATIVSWGGNYVSANQVFTDTTTASPNSYRTYTNAGQSYSTLKNSLQNLTPGSGYVAPSGKTANFSGGFMGSSGTGPAGIGGVNGTDSALSSRAVLDNGANDRISLSLSAPNPQIRGAITFSKADFLSDFSQETVGFDLTSTLSFSGILGGVRPIGQWLVQDGSIWYISLSTITQSASNTVETHTLADLNNALWAVYTPTLSDTAGAYFINAAPASGYAAHTFSDVQAVGIFFDSYGQPASPDGSSYSRFALQTFSASAVAVPEPAISILMALGLAIVIAKRRCSSY